MITLLMLLGPSRPSPALAQATAESPGSLAWMLRRMPPLPTTGDPPPLLIYADIAGQTAAAGLTVPADRADPAALRRWNALITPSLAFTWRRSLAVDPRWREVFGFDLLNVDQLVGYDAPATTMTLFRGRFDTDLVVERWLAAGYGLTASPHGDIFSIRDDNETDPALPGSRLAGRAMNHAVILAEDLIAFASTVAPLEQALEIGTGDGPSLADSAELGPMLDHAPPGITAAMIFSGSRLRAMRPPVAPPAGATPDARAPFPGELPPVTLVLVGKISGPAVPPGSPQPSRISDQTQFVILLTMVHAAAAETAAGVISHRLDAGAVPPTVAGDVPIPYGKFFPRHRVVAVPDEPVVVITVTPSPELANGYVTDLIVRRALSFLAWGS